MKNSSLINRRNWLRNTALSSVGLVMAANTGAFAYDQHLQDEPFTEQELLRLFSNENPYSPSPKVKSAMRQLLHRANRYANYHPVNPQALKEAIAKREGLKAENVVLGHGSYQVLTLIAIMYGKNKETIITPKPTFNVVGRYADHQMGANVKYIPLDKNYRMDLSAMRNAMDANTSLVFICNPNNPTGVLIPSAELRAFAGRTASKATLLVDEAYNELTDAPDDNSMIDMVRGGADMIVCRTFSKIYGMAGLRVGYAITSEANAERIRSHMMSFGGNLGGVAAALGCYNDFDFLAKSRAMVLEGREMIMEAVAKAGLTALPSQTNFVYVKVPDADAVQKGMMERGIRIRGAYGKWTQYSRVSTGMLADVERYAKALPEVIDALRV